MKFCIDIKPEEMLSRPDEFLETWKKSGIDSVQLYVAGQNRRSDIGKTAQARELLLEAGFEPALVAVPVGHPADITCPGDDHFLTPGWRIRTGRDGKPEYNSAELTDRMIQDVLQYSADYAALGFDTFFMDDDLRSGNLSPKVGGCFCDECIAGFSAEMGKAFTRESLLTADTRILERWCVYQSRRVTKLMQGLGKILPKPGIMIMNSGDERHGIAVHELSKIPSIQVRIGEEHFFDEFARSLTGRLENFAAVTGQLIRLGNQVETYSETTVLNTTAFGYTPTTPEHTLSKAYLALTAGVKNIEWMCHKHFDMMAKSYAALREYQAESSGERAYPVHVARDSFAAGTDYYPDLTAAGLGLPAAPVFAPEATGGQLLVLPRQLAQQPAWKAAAEKYQKVVAPEELEKAVRDSDIPHSENGQPLCLSWIPGRSRVAVYNPLEARQTVSVGGKTLQLAGGAAGVITF